MWVMEVYIVWVRIECIRNDNMATLVFNSLETSHTLSLSLSLTTLTNKSHIKYMVHKIEQNYNQIWHGIKANKNIVVNYNFTWTI